jgi:hypothetical protein
MTKVHAIIVLRRGYQSKVLSLLDCGLSNGGGVFN